MDVKETPWKSTRVAESFIRLVERTEAVRDRIARVNESMKKINADMRPGKELDGELEACLSQLAQVRDRVTQWKKYVAHHGADVALDLTLTFLRSTRRNFKKLDLGIQRLFVRLNLVNKLSCDHLARQIGCG